MNWRSTFTEEKKSKEIQEEASIIVTLSAVGLILFLLFVSIVAVSDSVLQQSSSDWGNYSQEFYYDDQLQSRRDWRFVITF